MPIVWHNPAQGGVVRVTFFLPGFINANLRAQETLAQLEQRLIGQVRAKIPDLAGWTPVVKNNNEIPTDRSQRFRWRFQGNTIVVDQTVPEP